MRSLTRSISRLGIAAFALLGLAAGSAKASTINVTNGSFSTTSSSTSAQVNYNGFTVNGWTNQTINNTLGYTFLFQSGTAVATGNSGNLSFWNSSNGGANEIVASPDGGNFIAMDGAYQTEPLTTTLTGLTVGSQLTVSFYYAGAQQYGAQYNTATTEGLNVYLYNSGTNTYESQSVTTLNNAVHGFTGWKSASVTFTPTATTEVLSFLATGGPGGQPPFTLLDGVTAQDNVVTSVTPEPSSLLLLGSGLLSVTGLVRRKFKARA